MLGHFGSHHLDFRIITDAIYRQLCERYVRSAPKEFYTFKHETLTKTVQHSEKSWIYEKSWTGKSLDGSVNIVKRQPIALPSRKFSDFPVRDLAVHCCQSFSRPDRYKQLVHNTIYEILPFSNGSFSPLELYDHLRSTLYTKCLLYCRGCYAFLTLNKART